MVVYFFGDEAGSKIAIVWRLYDRRDGTNRKARQL